MAYVMKCLDKGKKTMERAKNLQLKDNGWTPKLQLQHNRLIVSIVVAMTRAYRDPNMIPVLMWDSSKFA